MSRQSFTVGGRGAVWKIFMPCDVSHGGARVCEMYNYPLLLPLNVCRPDLDRNCCAMTRQVCMQLLTTTFRLGLFTVPKLYYLIYLQASARLFTPIYRIQNHWIVVKKLILSVKIVVFRGLSKTC